MVGSSHLILSESFLFVEVLFWVSAFEFSRGFLNCPHRETFTSFKCFLKKVMEKVGNHGYSFLIFSERWVSNEYLIVYRISGVFLVIFLVKRKFLKVLSSLATSCFMVVVLCALLSWLYLNVYKSKLHWLKTALCKLVFSHFLFMVFRPNMVRSKTPLWARVDVLARWVLISLRTRGC